MAFIKTLKEFISKNIVYPTTKTQAVYDDNVGRLDTYLSNTIGAEDVDDAEVEVAELRDADTLGGRYTAEDLDGMPKSESVSDYAQVEAPILDADRLGGRKASDYALAKDVIVNRNAINEINENLSPQIYDASVYGFTYGSIIKTGKVVTINATLVGVCEGAGKFNSTALPSALRPKAQKTYATYSRESSSTGTIELHLYIVKTDGFIYNASSASVYKTNINVSYETEY